MKLVSSYFVVFLTLLSGSVAFADPNEDLIRALHDDNPKAAEAAILKGANVNLIYSPRLNGECPQVESVLTFACQYKSVAIVETLLNYGADAHSGGSRSPIESAVLSEISSAAKVRLLLKYAVDVNTRGTRSLTPLDWAALRGDVEAMELLIQAGTEINSPSPFAVTPLFHTQWTEDTKVLLDSGASMHQVDHLGRTALSAAIEAGYVEKVKILIQHGADHCVDSSVIANVVEDPITENIFQILLSAGALRDSNEFGSRSE